MTSETSLTKRLTRIESSTHDRMRSVPVSADRHAFRRWRLGLLAIMAIVMTANPTFAIEITELIGQTPQRPLTPSSRQECNVYEKQMDAYVDNAMKRWRQCNDTTLDSWEECNRNQDVLYCVKQYQCDHCWPRKTQCGAVFSQWKSCLAIDEAYQCAKDARTENVNACNADLSRAQEEQRRQERYVAQQRQQIKAAGDIQRSEQQTRFTGAKQDAIARIDKYNAQRDEASRRHSVFATAATQNQSALAQAGSGERSTPRSVNDVVGGSLGSTLASIRQLVAGANSGADSHGSAPAILTDTPRAADGGRAAAIFDIFNWNGSATIHSAAKVLSLGESAAQSWSAWTGIRNAESNAVTGMTAMEIADLVLPAHAVFFAVPAMETAVSVHSAALYELDNAFRQFSQVALSGSDHSSKGQQSAPVDSFHHVQQAFVEGLCKYCRWDEARRGYNLGSNGFVQVDPEGGIDVGWDSIRDALWSH